MFKQQRASCHRVLLLEHCLRQLIKQICLSIVNKDRDRSGIPTDLAMRFSRMESWVHKEYELKYLINSRKGIVGVRKKSVRYKTRNDNGFLLRAIHFKCIGSTKEMVKKTNASPK